MADQSQQPVHVRIGGPPAVDLHLISDVELSTLENGGSHSWYETAGFSFFSIGASFWCSLLLGGPKSSNTTITLVIGTAGTAVGAVLLLLWTLSSKSSRTLAKEIRSRMAPVQSPWSPSAIAPPSKSEDGPAGLPKGQ